VGHFAPIKVNIAGSLLAGNVGNKGMEKLTHFRVIFNPEWIYDVGRWKEWLCRSYLLIPGNHLIMKDFLLTMVTYNPMIYRSLVNIQSKFNS